MTSFAYPCSLERDEDGRVLARFRDFPAAATDGADEVEALQEAIDLLESLLAFAVADAADIPEPSPARPGEKLVAPSATTALQIALYRAMREEGLTTETLGARLGIGASEAARLVDPRLRPPVRRLEGALAALGRRVTIALDAAE